MDIQPGFDSNYRFVLVAARRARQLQNGSVPKVSSASTKACRVAQDEVAAGKVQYSRRPEAVPEIAVVEMAEAHIEDLPPIVGL